MFRAFLRRSNVFRNARRMSAAIPAVILRRSRFSVPATACLTALLISAATATTTECKNDTKPIPMPYRMLGNTGLQVSVLSYGFWATFGSKDDILDKSGIEMAKECLRVARDAGINLFDNAEVYGTPYGEAERIMGIALQELQKEDPVKWRRSDIIITTKVSKFHL